MNMVDVKEVRERLHKLGRRPAGEAADWRKVLAADGNARLLGLIIARKPASVKELSELAGRAQPNVSRSLAALVRSGLVELRPNMRTSIPVATSFGLEKASVLEIAIQEEVAVRSATTDRHVSVEMDPPLDPRDRVRGWLEIRIPSKDGKLSCARHQGDLTRLAERWSSDLWRILHRRESYHLADVSVVQGDSTFEASLDVQPKAGRMELLVQKPADDDEPSKPIRWVMASDLFETALSRGLFAPVARELVCRREIDRPLHGNLAHLDEIKENPRDLAYWKTAGALGLGLADDFGDIVQKLMDEMPDEDARLEFASAVLPESFAGASAWIDNELNIHGDRNRLTELGTIARECSPIPVPAGAKPHWRGIALAKRVRELLRLNPEDAIGGLAGLADAMGASSYVAGDTTAAAGDIRGFRSDARGVPSVVIDGSNGPLSATFLLARGIGDYIGYGGAKAAITDVYTDRQRLGRAFAAELIAPSRAVVAMISEGQPRQRVAQHFGATSKMIDHQFANNVTLAA